MQQNRLKADNWRAKTFLLLLLKLQISLSSFHPFFQKLILNHEQNIFHKSEEADIVCHLASLIFRLTMTQCSPTFGADERPFRRDVQSSTFPLNQSFTKAEKQKAAELSAWISGRFFPFILLSTACQIGIKLILHLRLSFIELAGDIVSTHRPWGTVSCCLKTSFLIISILFRRVRSNLNQLQGEDKDSSSLSEIHCKSFSDLDILLLRIRGRLGV